VKIKRGLPPPQKGIAKQSANIVLHVSQIIQQIGAAHPSSQSSILIAIPCLPKSISYNH